MPAVTTSSPTATFSVESIWLMVRTPPSWPTTSPVAALVVSWPMTVDSLSVNRTTLALVGTDLGDPPGERPTGRDRDVTDRDPVVGALVEHDEPTELG